MQDSAAAPLLPDICASQSYCFPINGWLEGHLEPLSGYPGLHLLSQNSGESRTFMPNKRVERRIPARLRKRNAVNPSKSTPSSRLSDKSSTSSRERAARGVGLSLDRMLRPAYRAVSCGSSVAPSSPFKALSRRSSSSVSCKGAAIHAPL